MNTLWLMYIDAAVLILSAVCIGVLICADAYFRPIVPATILAALGGTAFLQAMWLLGVWIPGSAGYPWPRLGFDVALFLIVLWRTAPVVAMAHRENRRCLELRRRQMRAKANG